MLLKYEYSFLLLKPVPLTMSRTCEFLALLHLVWWSPCIFLYLIQSVWVLNFLALLYARFFCLAWRLTCLLNQGYFSRVKVILTETKAFTVSVHFCLKSDHKVFIGKEVSWELVKLLENSSSTFSCRLCQLLHISKSCAELVSVF